MTMDWKKCFLNVPLNDAGMLEYDNNDPEWNNVFTVELTHVEYHILWRVFNDWNDKFDILIDIFEEETLNPENAQEAMVILERHIEKNSGNQDFLNAAEKLKSALEKAIEVNMPLFLDF